MVFLPDIEVRIFRYSEVLIENSRENERFKRCNRDSQQFVFYPMRTPLPLSVVGVLPIRLTRVTELLHYNSLESQSPAGLTVLKRTYLHCFKP